MHSKLIRPRHFSLKAKVAIASPVTVATSVRETERCRTVFIRIFSSSWIHPNTSVWICINRRFFDALGIVHSIPVYITKQVIIKKAKSCDLCHLCAGGAAFPFFLSPAAQKLNEMPKLKTPWIFQLWSPAGDWWNDPQDVDYLEATWGMEEQQMAESQNAKEAEQNHNGFVVENRVSRDMSWNWHDSIWFKASCKTPKEEQQRYASWLAL